MCLAGPAQEAEEEIDYAGLRRESFTNLKQIMIAMHTHHDALQDVSGGLQRRQTGPAAIELCVALLPFFHEEQLTQLYNEFHLKEPWDSPHNLTLIGKMPNVYRALLRKPSKAGRST